jgi:hypothetical protein
VLIRRNRQRQHRAGNREQRADADGIIAGVEIAAADLDAGEEADGDRDDGHRGEGGAAEQDQRRSVAEPVALRTQICAGVDGHRFDGLHSSAGRVGRASLVPIMRH